ncbi:MAG: WD40 repeat domain-containing protein [Chloroflexi bacterium]|nr:WD40 repeat domain-containing protein [Chloroflexota bacterium]
MKHSTLFRNPQVLARWVVSLVALVVVAFATPSVRPANAQEATCSLDSLRGSQGCELRLDDFKRYDMTDANEQHKWRLTLDHATNLFIQLFTPGADYEVWLYAGDNSTLLGGGSHEDQPVDPYVMRYLQPGTYFVHIRSPRETPPSTGYVLHVSELGYAQPAAVQSAPLTSDSAASVRSLSLFSQRGLPWQIAFSPDGQRLAAAVTSLRDLGDQESVNGTGLLRDYGVKVWDVKQGREIASLTGGGDSTVYDVKYSPDGRLLAAAWGNNIVLWDASTLQFVRRLSGHAHEISRLAFSPDGRTLASGTIDGQLKLWDLSNGAERATPADGGDNNDPITGIAFSPDGNLLATSSKTSGVTLWNVKSGTRQGSLQGLSDAVIDLAFSPSAPLLATGSRDGGVTEWSVPELRQLTTLPSDGRVRAVQFSPDGKLLAAAYEPSSGVAQASDGTDLFDPEQTGTAIRLWDVGAGTLLRTLQPVYPHLALAFSPSGNMLASSGPDRFVALWGVPDLSGATHPAHAADRTPAMLWSDNFDDPELAALPSSTPDQPRFTRGYADGEYFIQRIDPSVGVPTTVLPGTYADASVAIDTRIVGDPNGQVIALACRSSSGPDGDSQYRLSVSPADGSFQLSLWQSGTSTPLVPWTSDASIHPGTDSNHLELSCADAAIDVLVNGHQVAHVTDATVRRGAFWIGVDGGQSEVRFDNLAVSLR